MHSNLNKGKGTNIDNLIEKISKESPSISSMLRGLSRMTVVPTMASGGVKSNVVPDAFSLVCDIRVLPGQDIGYVTNELGNVLNGIEGYELVVRGTTSPSASPPDDEFLAAIRRSLVKAMGANVDVMPSLTIGFTDSSAVRPYCYQRLRHTCVAMEGPRPGCPTGGPPYRPSERPCRQALPA